MISLSRNSPWGAPVLPCARAETRSPRPRNAKGVRRAMIRIETRNRLVAIVSLSLVLAIVPACTASAGHGLFRRGWDNVVVQPGPEPLPYVAYRPVFPVPGTKPLYLGGYAGA